MYCAVRVCACVRVHMHVVLYSILVLFSRQTEVIESNQDVEQFPVIINVNFVILH